MKLFENTLGLVLMAFVLMSTLSITPATFAAEAAETQPADAEKADDAEDKSPNMDALLDPNHESWSRQAPETFKVKFTTTQGNVVIQVTREWAPLGADRFYNLVDNGFYDGVKFFRVIDGFMAQFGINGNPEVSAVWRDQPINDDPNKVKNSRGRITFAMAGPNTRTSQLFISFGDNSFLDNQGFSPFGEVIEGMEVIDALYAGYGEGAPRGNGPEQGRVQHEGNPYLEAEFPRLDSLNTARIVD
tara:strand:+ start:294 stop:1028 length:735 start_codon:yes stop_codon:yes gene_type:complete